jgi:hypothetical protein
MNKEAITARRAALTSARDQAIANVNLITGGIQDCDYWLTMIEQEAAKAAAAGDEGLGWGEGDPGMENDNG